MMNKILIGREFQHKSQIYAVYEDLNTGFKI